ncbi:hypothetical protein D5F01_LYC00746 [Larimichthys crocea]|uniref:Fibronectin type-III domain-containing protein n=1 Tax=Larimichthys crocea TaxID=215358 RepID=A0A6G0JAN4_LARCR|nr:hypothetical protein D5F01_LYC00746 [Larimichthys crocea]
MLSDGLFTALLLLISGVSVETVPSPTNVTVNCHNPKVIVSWKYSNEQPQTIFRVEIISSFGCRFNNLKTTSLKCILQFPLVNLNEKDSGATVNFMNPYHHYKELKQASKSALASFTVTVTLDDVTIHVITLVTLLSVVVFIIAAAIICICKAKAWTMDIPSPPKFLLPNHREQDLDYDKVSIADITVGPAFISYKDSLVSSEEENSPTKKLQDHSSGSDFEYSAREKRGLSDSRNQDLEAAGLLSEGQRTDDDSVKTECASMDLGEEEEEEEEEEVERSPYDCPHTVQVDMGDGDIATGYTGR